MIGRWAREAGIGTPDAVQGSPRALRHRELAERLWAVNVDRAPPAGRGARVRDRAGEGALRPLLRWYVAPLVDAQREFNDVTLKLIDELHEAVSASLDERLLVELEERVLRLGARPDGTCAAASPRAFEEGLRADRLLRLRGAHARLPRGRARTPAAVRRGLPGRRSRPGRLRARGLLSLLQEAEVEATGVDRDPDMVALCRAEGLEVEQGDAVAHLEGLPDESLGGVFAAQVVEHLPPAPLVRLLELACAKLRPGGSSSPRR